MRAALKPVRRWCRRRLALILSRYGERGGFVLTGIPRSGTSLMCTLLSSSPDAHCFNEICYDVHHLPSFFRRMRRRIAAGGPIPARVHPDGSPITSTGRQKYSPVRSVRVPGKQVTRIGSKVTAPYLNRLPDLLELGYPIVALVRDPVFTIASWRSGKMRDAPMDRVVEGDRHPHWVGVRFERDEKLERQAELWNHYADELARHPDRLLLVRYEDLVAERDEVLRRVADRLGIRPPRPDERLETRNRPENYREVEAIALVVGELCPTRRRFGYG